MPQPGIHPMWGQNYLFDVRHSFDLPMGAVVAIVGGKRYPALRACWCTWFSSGEHSSFGTMIVINGRLSFAEKQDEYERVEYANGQPLHLALSESNLALPKGKRQAVKASAKRKSARSEP